MVTLITLKTNSNCLHVNLIDFQDNLKPSLDNAFVHYSPGRCECKKDLARSSDREWHVNPSSKAYSCNVCKRRTEEFAFSESNVSIDIAH